MKSLNSELKSSSYRDVECGGKDGWQGFNGAIPGEP